jgi:hypothetical protein
MQNYETLILEALGEGTPREKYERLEAMKNLLSAIGFPRRGTWEEHMGITTAAEHAQKILKTIDIDSE